MPDRCSRRYSWTHTSHVSPRCPALGGSLFVRNNGEECRGFTCLPLPRSHGFYFYSTISPLVIFNGLADKRLEEVWGLLAGSEERREGRERAVPAAGAGLCPIEPTLRTSAQPVLLTPEPSRPSTGCPLTLCLKSTQTTPSPTVFQSRELNHHCCSLIQGSSSAPQKSILHGWYF